MTDELCPCGLPLRHYSNPATQMLVEDLIDRLGPLVRVEVEGRAWMVPRRYIALHGLRGADLATGLAVAYGLEEVT